MGSKETFAQLEISFPTVYNMSMFENFLFSTIIRTGRYDDVTVTSKMKTFPGVPGWGLFFCKTTLKDGSNGAKFSLLRICSHVDYISS